MFIQITLNNYILTLISINYCMEYLDFIYFGFVNVQEVDILRLWKKVTTQIDLIAPSFMSGSLIISYPQGFSQNTY